MATEHGNRLTSVFFQQPTLTLARNLLGCRLVRFLNGERLSGWIVETEAYLADGDPASHSAAGLRRKNRSMFLPAGHLYVYCIHTHHCLNVVSEPEGQGAAVLIRAVEPIEGASRMSLLRSECGPRELTRGPGRLCQALQVTRQLDGLDLTDGQQLWLEAGSWHASDARPRVAHRPRQQLAVESRPAAATAPWRIGCSGRIGIRQAADQPWRFFIDGNRYVSGRASCHSRPPRDQLGRLQPPR
jgi:DNA-3-methyladenine glycosylase